MCLMMATTHSVWQNRYSITCIEPKTQMQALTAFQDQWFQEQSMLRNFTNGDVDITFSVQLSACTGTYVAVWGINGEVIAWSVFCFIQEALHLLKVVVEQEAVEVVQVSMDVS